MSEAESQAMARLESLVAAINRVQAVVEFDLNGNVTDVNDNFLQIFGYTRGELIGQHHRTLCDPAYANSPEYRELWQRLGAGEYECGEIKRIHKDGSEVWLQASYNPILDMNGKPTQVVKFATDITAEVQKRSLAMLEMSTPVTKIWEGVLFAPIIGIVDSARSVDIMDKALTRIAETRATTLLLDISGVAMMDTAVANHLIKIARAAVLMGCRTVISGISPSIAQTITELGIELGSIETTATIETALRDSLRA